MGNALMGVMGGCGERGGVLGWGLEVVKGVVGWF